MQPNELNELQLQQYDDLLRHSIETAVRQARIQLDDLRPYFEAGQLKELPERLYRLNGMFSRIDLTLKEVSAALQQRTQDEEEVPENG